MGEQINTGNPTGQAVDQGAGVVENDARTEAPKAQTPRPATGSRRRAGRGTSRTAAKKASTSTGADSPGEASEAPGRRYRTHAVVPRRHQIKVLVDENEWALLNSAATKVDGLSLAGWLGSVASDAAAERPLISAEQYTRVWELTRALRRVGVNLNQIAAKLNAGGEVEGLQLAATLGALDKVLGQSSELLDVMTEVMRSPRQVPARARRITAEGAAGGPSAPGTTTADGDGGAQGGGPGR